MGLLRAVIYCRCSTEEESQIDALQKQVIEAKACLEENSWQLVDQYVESRSGTTSRQRKEYLRLIRDISTSKFDIIVIKSQDRLMRNTKDWYLFLDCLLTNGKRLYLYLERKFYTTDDALLTGIKAILAEEYSRELSKKIVNAHRHRQNKGGRVMLTNQVLGFEKLPDGNVQIVETEANIIRKIFQYCVAGYGSRCISNMLQQEGIKSKNGKDMTPATIRRIIRNPLFKGVFVMNRQHFDFETKRTIKNPKDQWIFKEGIVPAIVDEALWERANQIMSSRVEKSRTQECCPQGINKGAYLLSGKLVCGRCGRPYYRTWRKGHSDPEKKIVEWKCSGYVLNGKMATRGCNHVHLDEKILLGVLEQFSLQYFQLDSIKKEEIIQKAIQVLERSLCHDSSQEHMKLLQQEKNRAIEKKQVLLDKLLGNIISDNDYQTGNQELEVKIKELDAKMKEVESQLRGQKSITQRLETVQHRLEHGGLEHAIVGYMLEQEISDIIVHEWQIEVRFYGMQMQQRQPMYLDYPFAPTTQKGRIQDKVKMLHLMKETPNLTTQKIADQLGRSKRVINNRIKELREDGYISFCGVGRYGEWEVLQKEAECLEEIYKIRG